MDSIKRSDNFILVLTEGALDRCSTDGSIDWVRRVSETPVYFTLTNYEVRECIRHGSVVNGWQAK